jgi:hypothetical protein
MTETLAAAPDHHPIGLIVDDDLKRNRLTVFFRLLLAIPQAVWLGLWSILRRAARLQRAVPPRGHPSDDVPLPARRPVAAVPR